MSKENCAAHVKGIAPHSSGKSPFMCYLYDLMNQSVQRGGFAMVDVCGVIEYTIENPSCGVYGAKEERRKECEGPGPYRRGGVELGAGEGSRCEIRQQRVLRSARHRAGQIRDAASRNCREGLGGERDGGIRRDKADILPNQGQLRGSWDRWPGAQEAWSARSAQTSWRSAGVYSRATGGGRAHSSAPAGQPNCAEIPSQCSPADNRAGGRGKKNRALAPTGVGGPGRLAGVVSQYEVLRNAALGQPLPPETRYGLMLFLRRGMWAWTRVMAVPPSCIQQDARDRASSSFVTSDESRSVIHVFAAMAMNTELPGATS
jgi:hypothetical protein